MSFTPSKWDVQVVGRWNVAILSPAAIQTRLLQKQREEAVTIEVPVDGPAPFRVKADGLCVMAGSSRVSIESEQCSFEAVHRAMGIGARLLNWLPETPVSAAGINIRFQSSGAETEFLSLLQQPIDHLLADSGREIIERSTMRSLRFREGVINIHVAQSAESTLTVALNFHRSSSKSSDLIAWLEQDVGGLEAEVAAACEIIGIKRELVVDE